MINAKSRVTALAEMMGVLELNRPNNNHKSVPKVNKEYMNRDIPDVSFVRMVLIACGRNEIVVQNAAASPTNVIESIGYFIVI